MTGQPSAEAVMGPSRVQVFLKVLDKMESMEDKVGSKSAADIAKMAKLCKEAVILVRGFLVSRCYKEGSAKLLYALSDQKIEKVMSSGTITRGGPAEKQQRAPDADGDGSGRDIKSQQQLDQERQRGSPKHMGVLSDTG